MTNLLLLPIVIITVGAENYGVWLFILSIATYATYLDLGTGTALTHYLARSRGVGADHARERWVTASVLISTGAFLLSTSVVLPIAHLFVQSESSDPGLILAAGVALSSILFKPALAVLQGSGNYVLDRQLNIIAIVARGAGTIAVCMWAPSVFAVALVESAALLLPGILAVPSAIKRHRDASAPMGGNAVRPAIASLISYGTRSLSVSLLGVSILQGGTIFLGVVGTPTSITWWNAAFRIYTAARQANGWVVAPFLPALTRLMPTDRLAALRIVRAVTAASVGASALLVGVFIPIGGILVGWWLGSAAPALEISTTVSVLLIGLVLNAFHGPLSLAADAFGRPGAFFHAQALWVACFAAAAIPLYDQAGLVGLALALSAPLPIIEGLYLAKGRRVLGISVRLWARTIAVPMVVIFGCAAIVALVIGLTTQSGIAASVGFIVAAATVSYLLRKRLMIEDLGAALRAEL